MIYEADFVGCISLNLRSPMILRNYVSAVQVRVCFCGVTLWQS